MLLLCMTLFLGVEDAEVLSFLGMVERAGVDELIWNKNHNRITVKLLRILFQNLLLWVQNAEHLTSQTNNARIINILDAFINYVLDKT